MNKKIIGTILCLFIIGISVLPSITGKIQKLLCTKDINEVLPNRLRRV